MRTIAVVAAAALMASACGSLTGESSDRGDGATPAPTRKPAASATKKPSAKPSPKPSATRTPSPTPTPSPTTPSASPTTEASGGEAAGGEALSPVWYPDWSSSGGRGEAQPWPSDWPQPISLGPTGSGPLDGRVILVDPGHNAGNSTHASEINRRYWVGLEKICNTTGTATANGYAEAAYTFDVAERLARKLTDAGATVILTRDRDSTYTYGPCIQARGLLGGQVGAEFGVSIHADGGPKDGRGAFVYTPAPLDGYTSAEKARESQALAGDVLAGLAFQGLGGSTYLVPNISPDRQQGTLNTASTPMVIVETLNMQNAEDAAIAESERGRQRVADGLFAGIVRYANG